MWRCLINGPSSSGCDRWQLVEKRLGALTGMAAIGTLLEHIAGARRTSADFYGLAVPARALLLQGNRGIRLSDALNS